MTINVFPLVSIPMECLPTHGLLAEGLRELRKKCLKVHGYVLIRDISQEEHHGVKFFLKNKPGFDLAAEGAWLLGRIHKVNLDYHLSIVAWDVLSNNSPLDSVYRRIFYGVRTLCETLHSLNDRGSKEVVENESPFLWVLKPSYGIFDVMKGLPHEPVPSH